MEITGATHLVECGSTLVAPSPVKKLKFVFKTCLRGFRQRETQTNLQLQRLARRLAFGLQQILI